MIDADKQMIIRDKIDELIERAYWLLLHLRSEDEYDFCQSVNHFETSVVEFNKLCHRLLYPEEYGGGEEINR